MVKCCGCRFPDYLRWTRANTSFLIPASRVASSGWSVGLSRDNGRQEAGYLAVYLKPFA